MTEPQDGRVIEVRAQVACFSEGHLLTARHHREREAYVVLPGGHVEPGESLWEATVRELAEETGLVLTAGHLWALNEFISAERHVVDCTFYGTAWGGAVRLGSDPDAEQHPASLIGLVWLDREAFADAPFRPTILGRYLRAHWEDPTTIPTYLGTESA